MNTPFCEPSRPDDRELRHRALDWIGDDPDPGTRAALGALVARNDVAAIAELFAAPLVFGTAGLRGALGPGPSMMNRAVVGRTALALAAFLRRHVTGGVTPRVIIGFDARHQSDVFARDSAELLAGQGIDVMLFARPAPTPLLAFAATNFDAHAGVMVTASHNPATDNGYKVYVRIDGVCAQIIPPFDRGVLDEIGALGLLTTAPRSASYRTLDAQVVESYLERLTARVPSGPRELRVVYTPVHGVGGELVLAALGRTGFTDVFTVREQFDPDPDFPTAPRPNPEEPGVLDLARALAEHVAADVVLASDPDADRLAVMIPEQSGWRRLSGDEVGVLLADFLLEENMLGDGPLVSTVVSSTALARLADAYGRDHVATLTGFKWICRVPGLAYGYEEALGYCVDPGAVPDKDGVSALVLFAHAAATWKARGVSVQDRIDSLAVRFGAYHTAQRTLPIASPAGGLALLDRLVASVPTVAGQTPVVIDHRDPVELSGPSFDGVRLVFADGSWLLVRPSGTEPKIKVYVEVREPACALTPRDARARADVRANALLDELLAYCTA